jgi:tRNA(Arg) A34 adenosine deaminase TadA
MQSAVALVHSRVRRVVFAEQNPDEIGGLRTARIHIERAINHRYEAFHLPLSMLNSIGANCEGEIE